MATYFFSEERRFSILEFSLSTAFMNLVWFEVFFNVGFCLRLNSSTFTKSDIR